MSRLMLNVVRSRREVARLTAAGAVALVAASHRGAAAQDQVPFPSRMRVLHASPELGKIEVHLDGEEVLDEFTYGTASDWFEVDPGTARITISRDRAGINYVVYDAFVPAVPDQDYDVIIADPLLSEPILIPAPVDRSPLPGDTARVAAIHASVALPAVDIAKKGGDVIIENVQFGQRSAPLEVPAGSYDLEVRSHETGQGVFELAGTSVEAGKVYHLVIYGDPGSTDTPLTSTILTSDARTPANSTPTS